ncbi:MAG: glycosyltransferase family 4 protein [Candidatus Diapherotrites archaeon]
MAKRIIVFVGHFKPTIGGIETYVDELFKRIAKKAVKVDIVTCYSGKINHFEHAKYFDIYRLSSWDLFGVYPIPKPTPRNFSLLFKLFRNKYSLVNTQIRFYPISFFGLFFAKLKGLPLIHTEHPSRHSVFSNKFIELCGKLYDHSFGTVLVKSANLNIGISKPTCAFLRHIGAKNVTLISNGVDTDSFNKKVYSPRNNKRFSADFKYITFVGRLIEAKGVQDLLIVFSEILKKRPRIRLLVVGDGPYKKELETLVKDKKISNVLFLGKMNQNEIKDILNITDIFVNPSYSEGLPTSVLEAGAMAVPIIATTTGGTSEIIDDGLNGFLISPKDRPNMSHYILLLLKNEDIRKKFGFAIRIKIKRKFSWNTVSSRFYNCLTNLIDEYEKTNY